MSETSEPAAEEIVDHPIAVSDTGLVLRRNTWVHVRDGVVARVKHVYSALVHPFTDLPENVYVGQNDGSRMTVPMQGDAVIPGREGMVMVGDLVDTKGNFTPTEGRTGRLHPSEPAYLAGPGMDVTGARATKDDDKVLAASQKRTEDLAKAKEELAEHPEQAPVVNTMAVPVTSETVAEEEGEAKA